MSINLSKKKRDDLLDKIKEIRKYIASAPQDENTGNLLLYLNQIEKDVNCNAALCSRRKKHFIFDSINTITAPSFR